MAELPEYRKFGSEAFSSPSSLSKLAGSLNRFFEGVIRALNKNLNIKENFDGEVITVLVDGSSFPLDIKWTRPTPPAVVWIGKVRETDVEHTTLTSAFSIDWEYSTKGFLRILSTPGISYTSKKYHITIVALTG